MKVTLDDIRAAAEEKYGDFEIDLGEDRTLVLRHALRLSKENRERLFALIETVESSRGSDGQASAAAEPQAAEQGSGEVPAGTAQGQDIEAVIGAIRDLLRLIADRADYGEVLLGAIGDDLPMLMELFERYLAVAMPGEASPSDA